MMICSRCNQNDAVVFVTKIEDGKQSQDGLCLNCASEMGMQPLNNLFSQSGMSPEDIQALNDQMGSLFQDLQNGNLKFEDLIAAGGQFGEMPKLPSDAEDADEESDDGFDADEDDGEGDSQTRMLATSSTGDSNLLDPSKNPFTKERTKEKEHDKPKKKKFLDTFGTNINRKAMDGKIDRIIGRTEEIQRVVQILNRRAKNNPCLIGEPGVGKTAIAEGLAVKIVQHQVPAKLADKEVYLLDMTSVVAGTQFRGQFEARMKGILDEARAFGNIILVIDEIHNIIGAGDAEGSMNAANILKPSLARGEIQIIGATTLDEYRKHIEKDSALERRFQPVIVDEPSVADTIEILKGIKDYYEDYHRVKISDFVIQTAVEMSERYISDRFLPDKAIDVIDEAGSRINLRNEKLVDLSKHKAEIQEIRAEIDASVAESDTHDYQHVADLKVRECKLAETIAALEDKTNDPQLSVEDIASVIEAWTKIPVQRITEVEAEKLINLEDRLKLRVIGQDEAIRLLSRTIRRSRAGFKKRKKPASFIFTGPTGVGKTELVRALAADLFETEEAIIRLDMSEYMEKHTVSKLIGSPPGYVGYDDGGQLTEKVRRKPYSVILLDEIEKAHAEVFNILLQILDEGRLSDSHGRVVNFENTIIIMTSNAGAHIKQGAVGFKSDLSKSMKEKEQDVLKDTFRPEFLNRIDEIVVFSNLEMPELRKIVKLMLTEVINEALEKQITLSFDEEAISLILKKGYDQKYGARPMRRVIQSQIEDELSEMFLKGQMKPGSKISVSVAEEKFTFKNTGE
ncbi:MAG: AAA family ATPase [Clostridia bacterium]